MTYAGGFAGEQLRSLVERIERLEEEKAAIAEDIKDVYGEAKANGFDNKTIRKIIKLRKQEQHEVQEEHIMLNLYMQALDMEPLPGFSEACGDAEAYHSKQDTSVSEGTLKVLAQIKEQGGSFHAFNSDDKKIAAMLEKEGFLAGVATNGWVLTELGNDVCMSA